MAKKLLPREVRYKDETMYAESVLAYREQFSLTPSPGFRRDIVATIRTHEDLIIWVQLLAAWGYTDRKTGKWKPRNPLDIKGLLTCFEFKQREAQRKKDEQREREQLARQSQDTNSATLPARYRKRLQRGHSSGLQTVRVEAPSNYFRSR